MPIGSIANDPKTPFHVYEFVFNERVFYVGSTHHPVRSGGRWGHVRNLVEHEKRGTLKPAKKLDLNRKSNRVIASLIYAGLPEFSVNIPWRGIGKVQGEKEEKAQILKRLSEGCVLANIRDNPQPASVEEILRYIGLAANAADRRSGEE
jgi:hypothetical protein